MTLMEVHIRLASTAILYTIILALWGLWRFFRRQGVDSAYWGALAIAEILYVFELGLGLYLWLASGVPTPGMHLLYGVVSILVIPAVFFYTRGNEERRAVLLYGVSLLFLMGIAFRAMATAT